MTVSEHVLADLPESYRHWRASRLGRITEDLEQELIIELCGDLSGLCALDVGCGDGSLTARLAKGGADVTGLDSDPRMLDAARLRLDVEQTSARLLSGDAQALPFETASFDLVTAVTLLCLVPDPDRAVQEIARVLRPGGRLVVGELHRQSYWAAERRVRGWLGSATWKAAHFWNVAELRRLLARSGLKADKVRGAIFYPPIGRLAGLMAKVDPWLGRRTTIGGAFIALSAHRQLAGAGSTIGAPAQLIRNAAKTGRLTWSRISANPIAATNTIARMGQGSGAIRTPERASAETMAMSTAEAASTQALGVELQMRRRSRTT